MLNKILAFIFSLTSSLIFIKVFSVLNSFDKQKHDSPFDFTGIGVLLHMLCFWIPAVITALLGLIFLSSACYRRINSYKNILNILSFLFLLPAIYSVSYVIVYIFILFLIEHNIIQESTTINNIANSISISVFIAAAILLIYFLFIAPIVKLKKKLQYNQSLQRTEGS
jgi:hypothetical protein